MFEFVVVFVLVFVFGTVVVVGGGVDTLELVVVVLAVIFGL